MMRFASLNVAYPDNNDNINNLKEGAFPIANMNRDSERIRIRQNSLRSDIPRGLL